MNTTNIKSTTKQALILMAALLLCFTSCQKKTDIPGFKRTESGLHYQFKHQNSSGKAVELDDALECEVILQLNNDTLYSNIGEPARLLQASESRFYGDLSEGLVMMHTGDTAIFAIEADSLARFHTMPATYAPHRGDKMYYTVILHNIVSADSIAKEESLFIRTMEDLRNSEPNSIAQYVQEHNIKAHPDSDGVYVEVTKKGKGPKIKVGSAVKFNYTGRLIDGTIFDTNIETVARQNDTYDAGRNYSPEHCVIGSTGYVKGLLQGLSELEQGSQATIIIPSSMAYGAEGKGSKIPPYSTLIFDVEVISVQ